MVQLYLQIYISSSGKNNLISVFLVLLIAGLATLALLWWLFNATEGVYLGRSMVIKLYDRFADRYDKVKGAHPLHESANLSLPLLVELPDASPPLVLDVATGTGRLPAALFAETEFQGTIVGIDLSRKMLAVAAHKLQEYVETERLYLLHAPAEKLPFPDDTFDVVTCLEALEFMMSPMTALEEIVRVARPGALLRFSNRQGLQARLMPGKTMSNLRFLDMLEYDLEVENIRIDDSWMSNYALIHATKPGNSPIVGARPLTEFWQCPTCEQTQWALDKNRWRCTNCNFSVIIADDGVIELSKEA